MSSEVIKVIANLFFLVLGVGLVALAFFAPRGKGELGARLKRIALFIAGSLMAVSAILRIISK